MTSVNSKSSTYFDKDGRPVCRIAKDSLTSTWYVCHKEMLFMGCPPRWVITQGGFPSAHAAFNYAKEKFPHIQIGGE